MHIRLTEAPGLDPHNGFRRRSPLLEQCMVPKHLILSSSWDHLGNSNSDDCFRNIFQKLILGWSKNSFKFFHKTLWNIISHYLKSEFKECTFHDPTDINIFLLVGYYFGLFISSIIFLKLKIYNGLACAQIGCLKIGSLFKWIISSQNLTANCCFSCPSYLYVVQCTGYTRYTDHMRRT